MGENADRLIGLIESELEATAPAATSGAPTSLSPAERDLVRDVQAQRQAVLAVSASVRSSVIRSLCLHPDMAAGGQLGVLRVEGGTITEPLDLCGLNLDFSLRFTDTHFEQKLFLQDTRLVSLELHGGSAAGIDADRVEIAHDLVLSNGFRCTRPVWLRSARIGGDLNCMGGSFVTPAEEPSLQFDGVHVGGRFFGRKVGHHPFHANHGVYGRNARIDRGFLCRGGHFDRELDLTRATVQGKVSLHEATVGGEMTGESDPDSAALQLDGLTAMGDLDLREARIGANTILLRRAKIEGRLVWDVRRMGGTTDPPLTVDLKQTQVRMLDDKKPDSWNGMEVALDGFSFDALAIPRDPKWQVRRRNRGLLSHPKWLWRRLEWLNQQPQGRWSPYPYDQVRAALQSSGEESAAREVAIARERVRRSRGGMGWLGKRASEFYGAVLGYGYKPFRFFVVSALVVAAFFIVYEADLTACEPHTGDAACGSFSMPKAGAPPFRAMMFSIDAFVPVDLGQTSAWVPTGSLFSYVVALETALGWLLTALLLGAVTGVLRRD